MYQIVKYKDLDDVRLLIAKIDRNNSTSESHDAYWKVCDMLYARNNDKKEDSPEKGRILIDNRKLSQISQLVSESEENIRYGYVDDAYNKLKEVEWIIYELYNPFGPLQQTHVSIPTAKDG